MPRHRFTIQERTEMEQAYKNGSSLRQIAEKYNTSHSAVERIVNRAGIMRDRGGVYPKAPSKGLLSWLKS